MKNTVLFILLIALASCKKGSGNDPQPPAVLRDGIYINGYMGTGTVSNSGVVAPAGYQWSECQNDLGVTTVSNSTVGLGAGYNSFNHYKMADNFVVPAGQSWQLSRVSVYVQGEYLSTGNFDTLHLQIWNGDPSISGSSVVYGNMTSNVLSNVLDSMTMCIQNSSYPAPGIVPVNYNKIFKLSANINTTLSAGTYWIVYQVHRSDESFSFTPSVKVKGTRGLSGWNAQICNSQDVWQPYKDTGKPISISGVNQDIPFEVVYKY